jgi:lysine-N-methylase
MPGPALTHDREQHYACQDCPAKCCRYPWRIQLDHAEYDQLINIPWIVERLRAGKVWFLEDGNTFRLPRSRQPDGSMACVFLDADNRCSIQVKEGHDKMPLTCQSYPFSFLEATPTPDTPPDKLPAVAHTVVSFFCKAVQRNVGDPISQKIKHRYQKARYHGRVLRLPASAPLGRGVSLLAEAYPVLSAAWEQLFDQPDTTAQQALWRGRVLLEEVIRRGNPKKPYTAQQLQAVLGELPQQPPLPTAKAHNLPGRLLLTLTLYPLLLYGLEDLPPVASSPTPPRIFQILRDVFLENGRYPIWGLPQSVPLWQTGQVTVDEAQPESQAVLKRYYRQYFKSYWIFFTGHPLLESYLTLTLTYPYALKLARCHALAHERDTAKAEDLLEGLGYADVLASQSHQPVDNQVNKIKSLLFRFFSGRPHWTAQVLQTESRPPAASPAGSDGAGE